MKDYCYRKVKKKFKVFPSRYAGFALSKCRKALKKNPSYPDHYKSADDFQDYWIAKGVDNGVNIYGGGKYLKPNRIVIVKSGRGMGLGTKFMEDLIRFADSKKLQIRLSPSSEYGASSVARLKDFYKRFGFVENAGRNKDFSISDTMYREARNLIQENPVPPKAVSRVACQALAKRRKYKRGGTAVGVARARDLCNRKNVSMRTIKRTFSYFSRHRASRAENRRRLADPVSPARIADELWGGTPGYRWVKKVLG